MWKPPLGLDGHVEDKPRGEREVFVGSIHYN